MSTKILLTDLDETLLTSDKEISRENLDAISAMTKAGHKFVIATGRPYYSARKLCEKYGFIGPGFYMIASNGGVIYDCTTEKFLLRCTLSFEDVDMIFKAARAVGLHVQTYTDDYVVAEKETFEIKAYTQKIAMPYKILSSIPQDLPYEPPKVIVISAAENSREILENFRQSLAPSIEGRINTVFSTKNLLEFLPPEATKGNALVKMCEIFDIPAEDSIACGDEENDLTMIDAAGIGVAVANASDLVKSHAGYITSRSNNENAIAEVIENLVLNQ